MGLWCRVCPDLKLLDPVQAKDVVREALIEADQKQGFRQALWMGPLFGVLGAFLVKYPWWLLLPVAALLAAHGCHFWLTRHALGRRLPKALAEARASAPV